MSRSMSAAPQGPHISSLRNCSLKLKMGLILQQGALSQFLSGSIFAISQFTLKGHRVIIYYLV